MQCCAQRCRTLGINAGSTDAAALAVDELCPHTVTAEMTPRKTTLLLIWMRPLEVYNFDLLKCTSSLAPGLPKAYKQPRNPIVAEGGLAKLQGGRLPGRSVGSRRAEGR